MNREIQSTPSFAKDHKFSARPYIREGLTESNILQIKSYFDLFDKENIGSINPKQLKGIIESFGPEAKSQSIYQLLLDLDGEGSGNISFEQFIHLMTPKLLKEDSKQNISKIFALFDDQKTGFISIKTLRRAIKQLRLDYSEEDMQLMISKVGKDKIGYVSQQQFCNLISQYSD